MANPQWEEGYTKIANEIMEALTRFNFSPYETRILRVIFRKTYGFNKKTDRISTSQFAQATGIPRRHVTPIIQRLIARKIITCLSDSQRREYGLQKDYSQWKSITYLRKVSPVYTQLSPKHVTKLSLKQVHTKEKRKDKRNILVSNDFFSLEKDFYDTLKKAYPKINLNSELNKMEAWLKSNPTKRYKNYKRFINSWLSRCNGNLPKLQNPEEMIKERALQLRRQVDYELPWATWLKDAEKELKKEGKLP